MKKIAFLGMCAGMLLATSCTNDDLTFSEGDTRVNFTVGLDGGIGTRAISDGTGAHKLVYALYDKDNQLINSLPGADDNGQITKNDAFPSELKDKVTLSLAKGQTYTIVFWAQNAECTAYTTTDLTNVQVNYEGINNDETRDAFYAAYEFTVSGNEDFDVTLKRPFAQINVGVTEEDWNAAVASNINLETSKAEFEDVPNAINLLDGTVSGSENITYDFGTMPAKFTPAEDLKVKTQDEGETEATEKVYKYLSMNYILADVNVNTVSSMKFTLHPQSGQDIDVSKGLIAVPYQRNWRTNIIGRLLTGVMDFTIVIDPIYDGDYIVGDIEPVTDGVQLDEANKTYYISNQNGLIWFYKASNGVGESLTFEGYTVMLTADIDMKYIVMTAGFGNNVQFLGTFDGGNNTISNATIKVNSKSAPAGLFAKSANVKNLKLTDLLVTGHYKVGAVVGDGLCSHIDNCHVDGASLVSMPNSDNEHGNNVGGIVGYLSAEPSASVTNCSVSNTDIVGYSDLGGIVGTINGDGSNKAVVTNNSVSNVTVTANQMSKYNGTREANAGEIYGRKLSGTLKKNTSNNVTVTILAPVAPGETAEVANVPLEAISNIASTDVSEIKLNSDVEGMAVTKTGYGDPCGTVLGEGMDFDGGGNTITVTGNLYKVHVLETHGGTVKNVSFVNGERGIYTFSPTEDVVIEGVTIDGPGYGINTAEPAKFQNLKLIVRNSTVNGWTSFNGGFASAEFTNCNIGFNTKGYWQKMGYNKLYDGLIKPYITTTFSGCNFDKDVYIDLSELKSGCTVTFDQCKVNGTVITAENFTTLLQHELKADVTSISDVIIFK